MESPFVVIAQEVTMSKKVAFSITAKLLYHKIVKFTTYYLWYIIKFWVLLCVFIKVLCDQYYLLLYAY